MDGWRNDEKMRENGRALTQDLRMGSIATTHSCGQARQDHLNISSTLGTSWDIVSKFSMAQLRHHLRWSYHWHPGSTRFGGLLHTLTAGLRIWSANLAANSMKLQVATYFRLLYCSILMCFASFASSNLSTLVSFGQAKQLHRVTKSNHPQQQSEHLEKRKHRHTGHSPEPSSHIRRCESLVAAVCQILYKRCMALQG